MSGIAAALVTGLSVGSAFAPFTSWNVRGDSPGGTTTAGMRFETNGTITDLSLPANSDGSGPGSFQWCSVINGSVGTRYWLRATVTSGTLTSGTTGAWLSLASPQGFVKSGGAGTGSVTLTFQLATDPAGSNIIATWTGNILTFAHTPA